MKNNPFFSIWVRPRQTIAPILENHPTRYVLLLAAILGTLGLLTEALNPKYAELGIHPTPLTLFIAVIMGAVLGILGLYLTGWLYSMVGGWFDGKANAMQIRCALMWGALPRITGLLILLLMVLLTSPLALAPDLWQPTSLGNTFVILIAYILILILGIWSIVLQCHTVGEAHGFSAWKSLLTFILAGIIAAFAVFLLAIPIIILIAGFA